MKTPKGGKFAAVYNFFFKYGQYFLQSDGQFASGLYERRAGQYRER
jgi:hypothetical protein